MMVLQENFMEKALEIQFLCHLELVKPSRKLPSGPLRMDSSLYLTILYFFYNLRQALEPQLAQNPQEEAKCMSSHRCGTMLFQGKIMTFPVELAWPSSQDMQLLIHHAVCLDSSISFFTIPRRI